MGPSRARGKMKSGQANNQEMTVSYFRTPEHRKLRAELIRRWKPWEKSTGPRSVEGKAKVSKNAFKGRTRQMLRELSRLLKEQEEVRQASERKVDALHISKR